MNELNRRAFLQRSARLAALLGLGAEAVPFLAEAVEQVTSGTAPLLWLQGQSCSGCSVSLLNSDPITPEQLLTRHLALQFHQTLSTATGHLAVETINQAIAAGGYLLVVEGSIPVSMPRACLFGGEPFGEQVLRAARNAKAIIAVGTCSAFGGIPAAPNNPTGASSLSAYLKAQAVQSPVVSIPGCPPHPDWIVGTLAHVLKWGLPPLDELGRPKAFFARLVHDQCPRFSDYERERFARSFADDGCFFKLGCLGPLTHADCSLRLWNGGTNFCIKAGAPCIGCASRHFAALPDFPFFVKHPQPAGGQS